MKLNTGVLASVSVTGALQTSACQGTVLLGDDTPDGMLLGQLAQLMLQLAVRFERLVIVAAYADLLQLLLRQVAVDDSELADSVWQHIHDVVSEVRIGWLSQKPMKLGVGLPTLLPINSHWRGSQLSCIGPTMLRTHRLSFWQCGELASVSWNRNCISPKQALSITVAERISDTFPVDCILCLSTMTVSNISLSVRVATCWYVRSKSLLSTRVSGRLLLGARV
jgi:hypothetical protein